MVSHDQLLNAISPDDGAKGAIMASPSRAHPNYYFHWIRDSALVMDTTYLFQKKEPAKVESMLVDYLNFSRRNQLTYNPSEAEFGRQGGEPKFMITGEPFMGGWGRPQNDGPALRALTMMRLANQWLATGKADKVGSLLYKAELPARTLIKADLEYVAHYWNEPNFDLWEENLGMHFYTLLVQMTSLKEGAKLAIVLGDAAAADFYQSQAALIEKVLASFWSESRGYYLVTQQQKNVENKASRLDVAVILGVLHAKREIGDFSIQDPRILRTAEALEREFGKLYRVNQPSARLASEGIAPGIGRYPEDIYDGYDGNEFMLGNPWYLCTMALAEFYYNLARLTPSSRAALKSQYFEHAEQFMKRVRLHTPADGSLSEQFNRDSGFAQGAAHLTWSYAALLTVDTARDAALANQL